MLAVMLLVCIVPGNTVAVDEAALEFGPTAVFSNEVNEFTLTFHNTADREIVLSDATAVIEWPGEPWFEDGFDPDIMIDFLDEAVTVPAGGSVSFERSVMVELQGGFSVHLSARGLFVGDATPTIFTGITGVDCEERQLLDSRTPLASAFSMFLLVFSVGMMGFFVQGAFWSYEIKKNLEEEDLDEFQWFKWFPHLWWNRGHKLRVVMLFAVIALLFALMTYSALT